MIKDVGEIINYTMVITYVETMLACQYFTCENKFNTIQAKEQRRFCLIDKSAI